LSLVTDADEIGMSAQLVLSVPLLGTLIQCVAQSDGDWNYLNVRLADGPRGRRCAPLVRGLPHRLDEPGDCTTEPYPAPLGEILIEHGFDFVPEYQGYMQLVRFDSDAAFTETALLMIGTFVHAWCAASDDHVGLELNLSLPPNRPALN
jgi:hypothetical protein